MNEVIDHSGKWNDRVNGSTEPTATLRKEFFSFKGQKSYRVVTVFFFVVPHCLVTHSFGMYTRPTLSVLGDD